MTTLNLSRTEGDIDASLLDEFRSEARITGLAVDVETTGLSPIEDRLEVVSIATPHKALVISLGRGLPINLADLLTDTSVTKLFHHAVFDLSFLASKWDLTLTPIFCSKVAARLVGVARNPTLQNLVEELVGKHLDKSLQRSDWSIRPLTDAQIAYAAEDVLHLHALRGELSRKLHETGRMTLFEGCMSFLSTRVELELLGVGDVFAHSIPPDVPRGTPFR